MRLFILGLIVICAEATPQYVKTAGVKGGYSGRGYQYHAGENLVSNYSNTQHGYRGYDGNGGYATRNNLTNAIDYEVGVCYIEVPTASLVSDRAHVPAGNGSSSDLSRIRTCCKGYTRNIHNFRICDPVCTKECVNGLCKAPDTCMCFPDHVKNLAGFCVPTCPIGCQNGHCSGGECICKDGYRLDSESKFCVPYCQEQCGRGGGNCTAPNTCECRSGYKSTPEGSCKPACDRCAGGECVAPNDCRCSYGYQKNREGDCEPQCSTPCTPPNRCVAPNVCDNANNPSTTTTVSPYGQQPIRVPYGQHPQNPYQQPNYSGQQPYNPSNPQSNYPGNQQSYYPGYPQSSYPGNPQSSYPGYPQSTYPGSQPNYPGSQPRYPSNQHYSPGSQPSNYTGNQPGTLPSSVHPSNQSNPSNLPSSYPGQRPANYPDSQPIYTQYPNNQPALYPDSQHANPDQHLNTDNNQQHNSSHPSPNSGPYYPNSPYYPDSQHNYPGQQRPSNYPYNQQPNPNPSSNAEPYYINSQYYPGSQYSSYPNDHNNYQIQPNHRYPGSNPSYGQGSEYQPIIIPDSQSSAVEVLCSQPCINGTCIGRDRCVCNTGYDTVVSDTSGTRCEPHCTGCSNGVCVSPYVCVCNPGYFKDFSVKGRSTCVRRIRRSVDETSAPINVAELLIFEIPDDE